MPDNAAPAPAEPQAPATPDKPTGEASWRDSLPEDLKESASLSKFETMEGLAKSYVNLERMLGSEKVSVPKDGDEEGWQRFYKAAGHPDSPDAYGFAKPENVPDGLEYNADLDKQLAGIMHKHGLNRNQAAGIRDAIINDILAKGALDGVESMNLQRQEYEAQLRQADESLRQEWGTAYEQRGKIAGAAINKFLSPETIAAMDAAGIANNPAIVKDMYNLGVKLSGEKGLIEADGELDSPADLDAQIADFRTKYSAALFDRSHPDHGQRTKEFTRLFERRFPAQGE
ncbi:hypothetical protein [Nitratireductor indicus]|uniref:hypothetical protein n=1 Tax=Nitratireductor indicus TaxID=721133 RepID=UPI002876C2E9|nr:hypothetical protein [Nitratireductor indicus]MDS1138584.1 hypothetical protein [Nitratireductor indicus]